MLTPILTARKISFNPAIARRERMIDAIRGAAVVLMLVDHTIGFAQTTTLNDPWMRVARLTLPRLSLPAFMICSGILLSGHPISRRRWFEVAIAASAVNLAAAWASMATFVPDILAIWCFVMVLASPIRRWPMTMATLGLVQSACWRLPIGNYQPGWVLAFVSLGVLVERTGEREVLAPLADRLPECTVSIGRHPLAWYVLHLAVLAGLTMSGRRLGWW